MWKTLRGFTVKRRNTGPSLEGNVGSSQAFNFFSKMGEVGILMGRILVGRGNAVSLEWWRVVKAMSPCR